MTNYYFLILPVCMANQLLLTWLENEGDVIGLCRIRWFMVVVAVTRDYWLVENFLKNWVHAWFSCREDDCLFNSDSNQKSIDWFAIAWSLMYLKFTCGLQETCSREMWNSNSILFGCCSAGGDDLRNLFISLFSNISVLLPYSNGEIMRLMYCTLMVQVHNFAWNFYFY